MYVCRDCAIPCYLSFAIDENVEYPPLRCPCDGRVASWIRMEEEK